MITPLLPCSFYIELYKSILSHSDNHVSIFLKHTNIFSFIFLVSNLEVLVLPGNNLASFTRPQHGQAVDCCSGLPGQTADREK